MLLLALGVAALQASQARLAPAHDGWRPRLVVAWLCYAQPLVRSWQRYCTRLFAYRPPTADSELRANGPGPLPLGGRREIAYWSEEGQQRTDLLGDPIRQWGGTKRADGNAVRNTMIGHLDTHIS